MANKTILIIDDESRITNSFKVIFESRDFFVQTASNGHDAIKIFKKYPFKVVLSDIQMDEMGGIELMHALRQIDPCVQIIFLTGYASIENAAKALKQNNAFDYLEKPVKNMNDLYKIVEKAESKYDREKYKVIQKEKQEKEFATFISIFDSMEASVYVSDMKTHEIIYTNKKLLETLGFDDQKDLKGQKCWQTIQKGQKEPCLFCTNKRLLNADGNPGEPYEWEFCNTLNNRWYSIVDKAIKWYDNRIVRLETAFDITQKKEHEKLFQKFKIAITTSRKFESICTLAGGVAHDFNNTLSAIIGNINLAQLVCPDNETQKYLQAAEKGVFQAKNISSKLTAFASGGRLLKTKIDIKKLINLTLGQCLDHKKITCSFESDPIPCSFYADASQLEIAIKNILQNAAESMDGCGRIDIAVKYMEQPLKKPQIFISISDSGCGISPEYLDMIFNPYFTTKPLGNQKSTGLGLSIAWSIITRHGGNIHVESTEKKGTSVHIFLPVFSENRIEDRNKADLKHPIKPDLDKTILRVLVMEDDQLILDAISELLTRLGYKTYVAPGGNQAIEICKTGRSCGRPIDIALLDFDIPYGLGGFPTMEQLKKTEPNIRGLLITGHIDNIEIKKYKDYGFSDILEKPFSIKQLNKKIRKILNN